MVRRPLGAEQWFNCAGWCEVLQTLRRVSAAWRCRPVIPRRTAPTRRRAPRAHRSRRRHLGPSPSCATRPRPAQMVCWLPTLPCPGSIAPCDVKLVLVCSLRCFALPWYLEPTLRFTGVDRTLCIVFHGGGCESIRCRAAAQGCSFQMLLRLHSMARLADRAYRAGDVDESS